ncbi:MAG: BamA/TamA family outer membrane protein [Brumimicrobium sp.]|nr:BamA/TamA family outer membrane protein [Brumimicrobium sp.]
MKIFLILAFFCSGFISLAQKDTTEYPPKIVGVPIVFYGPETSFGFGAAGFLSFKFQRGDSLLRPSQINAGAAYTLEKQLLTYASYDLWIKENNYNCTGELGYYRYFYNFWGVGLEPKQLEVYSLNFPRIRFEGVRRIKNALYGGLKFTFDDFSITEKETGGRLDQGLYPGTSGGKISGAGVIVKYDSRNHNFYPTSGWNIVGSFEKFDEVIGSDFSYNLTWLNLIRYFDLRRDKVLAANIYGRFMSGTVPFFHLSQMGGNRRMRGYYEGYHRDKQMIGWQAEFRTPVYRRFGWVIFAGNATVAERIESFSLGRFKTAVGTGIRFKLDEERKINLRLDFAVSSDRTTGFYFTLGEAF